MMSIYAFIKFIFFLLMTCLSIFWEICFPEREEYHKLLRVSHNYLLVIVNNLFLGFITFVLTFNLITLSSKVNFGILKMFTPNIWVSILVSVIFLDLVVYFQHRVFHKVDFLWKLHSVHHYDTELDFSSGLRFHPLEILISFFIKAVAILIIGAGPISVLIFEIILMSSAMFNHSNLHLNTIIDKRFLRYFIVTPSMHIIHHSKESSEMNMNYGFFLSIWDHLFKTHLWQRDESKPFTIGLYNIGMEEQNIISMLTFPWKKNDQ